MHGNLNMKFEEESEKCEICGVITLKLHCKIICNNCGFIRDCSDP